MESNAYLELFKDVLSGAIYDESAWTLVHDERRQAMTGSVAHKLKQKLENHAKNALVGFLGRRHIVMAHVRPFDRSARENGKDWPLIGYTMIGRKRLDNLQACLERVLDEGIEGDVIETGVWRGGAVMLMKAVLKARGISNRVVWVADSFAGLPKPASTSDGWDFSENKFFAVSRAAVQSNFERFGLLDENVRFLEGWFCDTLPTAPIKQLSVLRLDGDLYTSTMDSLVNLYPKMSKGGFVIVDDYHGWPGCKRAVEEYLASRKESPALLSIDEDAVFWRI